MKLIALALLLSSVCFAQQQTYVNGAVVPKSAACSGTNALGQIVEASCSGTGGGLNAPVSGSGALAGASGSSTTAIATFSQILASLGTGNVPNSALTNSSLTVNGVTCTLGGTCTVSGGGGGGFYQQFQANGSSVTPRNTFNLAGSGSVTVTPSDDGSITTFTLTATSGGGNTTSSTMTSGNLPLSTGANTLNDSGILATSVLTTTNTQVVTNKDLTSSTNTFRTLNQSTTGNAATATLAASATALAATPTLCSTGNAPTGITASGNATGCAAISGGTLPLTTKGDDIGFSTTAVRVAIGTDGFVKTADSTQAVGWKWAAVGGSTNSVTSGSGVPVASCTPGTGNFIYQDLALTNPGTAYYFCSSTNVWSPWFALGGSGALTYTGANGIPVIDINTAASPLLSGVVPFTGVQTMPSLKINGGNLIGIGTTPTYTITSCAATGGTLVGTNLSGTIPITGSGTGCVIAIISTTAVAAHYLCPALQNRVSGAISVQTADSTTTATFKAMTLAASDVLQYGTCSAN